MPEVYWIAVIVGIAFVFVFIRLLARLDQELALFGSVFGIIGLWHYHLTQFLNFPLLPMWLLQFAAVGAFTWAILRMIYIASLFPSPIQPILLQLSVAVNGR